MNADADMDYADFLSIATELVTGLMPRIPERWRGGFQEDLSEPIQEPRLFVHSLVATLADDQIPITPAERDTAVRLMEFAKTPLEQAGRFNVIEQTAQEG